MCKSCTANREGKTDTRKHTEGKKEMSESEGAGETGSQVDVRAWVQDGPCLLSACVRVTVRMCVSADR